MTEPTGGHVLSRPIRTWILTAWNLCLTLVWGIWWGGLCFYAVFVVPVGTAAIGSVEQGFITQQVTIWHNRVAVAFLLCLAMEAGRRRCRMLWLMSALLFIVTIALVAWHRHLTAMMDLTLHTVPKTFYAEHALYLWITAAEWFLGLVVPIWMFPHEPPTTTAARDERINRNVRA